MSSLRGNAMTSELYTSMYQFWNKVLPAWPSNTVPTGTALPYLTYTPVSSEWGTSTLGTAIIWSRSSSFRTATEAADKVEALIPAVVGTKIPLTGGGLWIKRGTPFIQHYPQEDPDEKAIYINYEVRSYIV